MSKVISLPEQQTYQLYLADAKEALVEAEDTFFTLAINLCCSGKWRKWSDDIEEGTPFEFDTEMLKDSGDQNVVMLVELVEKLHEVMKELDQ